MYVTTEIGLAVTVNPSLPTGLLVIMFELPGVPEPDIANN